MKPSAPNPGADSLIQYLNTHSSILTDQGINVRAFIDRLSALTCSSQPPSQPAPKSKARKKQAGARPPTGEKCDE